MKNALEIKIGGLKCDNPDCTYKDMSIDVKDYKNWVNAKCPKCGEILLTKMDYLNTKFLLGMVELANKIYPKQKYNEKEETIELEIKMDGSGKMDFNLKKDDSCKNK